MTAFGLVLIALGVLLMVAIYNNSFTSTLKAAGL